MKSVNQAITRYFSDNVNFVPPVQLSKNIHLYLQQFSGVDRINAAEPIMGSIQAYKKTATAKLELLKKQLAVDQALGWKSACLSTYNRAVYKEYFHSIKPNTDATYPIVFDDARFKILNASINGKDADKYYGVVGSTFTSNKPQYNKPGQDSHVLDATCIAQHLNEQGEVDGVIMALGDGCGGHFADAHQDKTIARSAHFASKHAVRVLSTFKHPDDLINHLGEIVAAIKLEVTQKSPLENTTLLCCRTFLHADGLRVVGFNIGDGLLAAWDVEQKKIRTLSPSVVTEYGVAQFPSVYKKHEVHAIDLIIPQTHQLFIMSDGMVDGLPTYQQDKVYPNNIKYRETYIDHNKFKFKREVSSQEQVEFLVMQVIQKMEDHRTQQLLGSSEMNQFGDDIAIAGVDLSVITARLKSDPGCVLS